MKPTTRLVILLLGAAAACAGPAQRKAPLARAADLERWEFTDPAAFRWCRDDASGGGCLELHQRAEYQPPHRSPHSIAILRDEEFGDFVMRVKARSTTADYNHLDLCFIFGYRDPAHYLYAHLATRADPNAHQVMLVDDAPRRPVTVERTEGVAWGSDWHDVELRRLGTAVVVRFDGEVVMRAEVPDWPGRIGLGSFDDTGRFRDLEIEAR